MEACWLSGPVVTTVLASRGFFQPQDAESAPPVGINLVVVLSVLAASLVTSASVRRLLTRQANLIRLHLWRLVGIVFLVLMVRGQMPALWALPAGIGDILIAVTAPWIAGQVDSPRGKRRAIAWNLLGISDLVVAVGTRNHDEPRSDTGLRHGANVRADHAISAGARADVPGSARVHASRGVSMATAWRDVGSSSTIFKHDPSVSSERRKTMADAKSLPFKV